MAISVNTLTDGLSGTVGGNMVFRRKKSGKIIVGRRPRRDRHLVATASQQDIRDRFKIGTIYAKAVMADPAKKAEYAAAADPDQSAFNLALKDAFKSPVVKSIDIVAYLGQAGNPIVVRAIDDFKVASVTVSIHKADGSLLEEGDALLQANGLDWLYIATSSSSTAGLTVTASAKDLPGNLATRDIKL